MSNVKIYLGDSRNLKQLMPVESIDLIVSGPPYWNEVVYSKDDAQLSKIEDYKKFLEEIGKVWESSLKVLKPGGVLSFWVHDFYRPDHKDQTEKTYIPFHADLLKNMPEGFILRNILIWDRYLSRNKGYYPNEAALGTKLEYILIFQKPGENQNKELIEQSLIKNFWNPVWNKKTYPKLLGSKFLFRIGFELGKHFKGLDGIRKTLNRTAIQDKYAFKNYLTEDPEEIIERLIADYSKEGDRVLDPFMGSGTVLKVAHRMGRRSIGVDVNPEAVEAAKKKLNFMVK